MLLALIGIWLLLISIWCWKRTLVRRQMPPGPPGYPLLGNALQVDPKNPMKAIIRWANMYGSVFTIEVFGSYMVIANDLNTIKEMTLKSSRAFSGRPVLYRFSYLNRYEDNLVLGQANNRWIHLKKAAVSGLRMQGGGLEKLETISVSLILEVCEKIERYQGEAFDIDNHVHSAVTHIISSLLYGYKLPDDTIQQFIELDHRLVEATNPAGAGCELDFMPWLRHIPGFKKHMLKLDALLDDMEQCFGPRLNQQKKNLNPDSLNCASDHLIQFQKDFTDNFSKRLISDRQLFNAHRDLLFTGMMTTSRALYAMFLLLIKNQDVQRKIQEEVDRVCGSRLARLDDRELCPYIESTILELLRYISHIPLGIPHKTTEDATLANYFIPAGTQVSANLFQLHHSDFWDEPYKFKADRFLENGALVSRDHPLRKNLMPFGAGRRGCIGDSMVKNRIFLFVAIFAQKFTLLTDDKHPDPDSDPRNFKPGIACSPHSYTMRAVTRTPLRESTDDDAGLTADT